MVSIRKAVSSFLGTDKPSELAKLEGRSKEADEAVNGFLEASDEQISEYQEKLKRVDDALAIAEQVAHFLENPESPKHQSGSWTENHHEGILTFNSKHSPDSEVCRKWKEQMPSWTKKSEFRVSSGHYLSHVTSYTVTKKDFDKVYNTAKEIARTKLLAANRKMVNEKNDLLEVILLKYADAIYKVHLYFQESKELNGEIDEQVMQKGLEIISFYLMEFDEAVSRMNELEELKKKRLTESMIDELEREVAFVKSNLIQTHEWGVINNGLAKRG